MKAFTKTVFRMFFANKGRFLANFLIVLLSVAITSGLGALTGSYAKSFATTYEKAPDLIIKSKDENGFKEEDLDEMKNLTNAKSSSGFFSLDYEDGDDIYRFYVYDFDSLSVGKPNIIKGNLPTKIEDNTVEVLAEEGNLNRTGYEVNDKIRLNNVKFGPFDFGTVDFVVAGISDSPLYNSVEKENAMLDDDSDDKYVKSIFYLDRKQIPDTIKMSTPMGDMEVPFTLPMTDIYLDLDSKNPYFSDAYKEEAKELKERIILRYGNDKVAVLTLDENVTYAVFRNYNEKITKISYVFPVFFILVCALVNLITISRLIEEERSLIGCYASLGVPKRKIVTKYTLFTFLSVFFGAIIGFVLGTPFIPRVVLPAYQAVFQIHSAPLNFLSPVGYICAGVVIVASLLVTIYLSLSSLKERPSNLLKAKAPKPGKKIWLQHIPFIWNHLSFSYKSSFRNIFRQKKHLILTSLSVIGATLLVLIGFALLDNSSALKSDEIYANVASSMGTISTVIILFAVSMAIVVVYSLANMNIQDRQREIATLKVLGYHDKECSKYTFREIMMISSFASLIALPISALVVAYVFEYLDFGSIKNVKWYSYVISYGVVILTTVFVNALLFPKVKHVNMNDSLKNLE